MALILPLVARRKLPFGARDVQLDGQNAGNAPGMTGFQTLRAIRNTKKLYKLDKFILKYEIFYFHHKILKQQILLF